MRLASGGAARGTLGEFVREAAIPAQERDDYSVQVRFLPFGSILGRFPHVIRRAGRNRPVAVLARHVKDLPTVASHKSILCAKLVASHL